MKLVVTLMLMVATASTISYSSKLLKHEMRQAQAPEGGSDLQNGAHVDRRTGARPDRRTGAHPDRRTVAHADRRTGAHADRRTDARPDRRTGAHADRRTGAHADRRTGAHADRRTDAHADRRTGGSVSRITDDSRRGFINHNAGLPTNIPYLPNGDPNEGGEVELPEGSSEKVYEKTESTRADWHNPELCQLNSWVKGMAVYQDGGSGDGGDEKGVTFVKLRCRSQVNGPVVYAHTISSGEPVGQFVPRVNCKGRSWMTGVRAIWGGNSVGISQLVPICQIPNYKGNRANAPGYYYNVTIPKYNWETHQDAGWEVHDLKCEADKAVCGFAVKNDWPLAQDLAGVMGLLIRCCHFTHYLEPRCSGERCFPRIGTYAQPSGGQFS